jgi:hypothetical protein
MHYTEGTHQQLATLFKLPAQAGLLGLATMVMCELILG